MKGKITSNVFKISFIPYILLVLYSVYNSMVGISTGFFGSGKLYYGFEGYSTAFIFMIFIFWYIFAVFPIVQLVVLLVEKIKNKTPILKYFLIMVAVYGAGCIPLMFE